MPKADSPCETSFSQSVVCHCRSGDSIAIDAVKAAKLLCCSVVAKDCMLPSTILCLEPGVFVVHHLSVQQKQQEADICIP